MPKSPGRNVRRKQPQANVSREALRGNAILVALDAHEADTVLAEGALVHLPVRYQIYEAEQAIHHVYFPIDCIISIVARMEDGDQIEVGTIGREGMSGIPLLLGATSTANEAYCQVPGSAVKVDVDLFRRLATDPKVRQLLDRHLQAYVNMLGQLAACNRLHNVYKRCARWLLMSQDRVGASTIRLTHEFLAMMLGTQRSGVTIALGTLQKAGFIEYSSGKIRIVDRVGLEEVSCECYDIARRQFAGLLRSVDPVTDEE